MSYRIGSLNIHKRIHKKSDSERDLFSFIHDFVADERLDILALQECLNESEVKRIQDRALSPFQSWKGQHRRPATGREGDYGFAFLWNANRVKECSQAHTPSIFSAYKSEGLRLSRDPLYGRFAPKLSEGSELQQEFRLINIHLRFSDEVLPDLTKISGITKRRKECFLVTGEIYRRINAPRDGSFKPAFTLVMGDYNLSVEECIANSGNKNVCTYQDEPTTLNSNRDGYASSYDHFSFDETKMASVQFIQRLNAVEKYFGGDYEKYYQAVSDHIPIVIEIF
jgi:Endonuclease/Exonuclease/phosphatase family.